MRPVQRGAALDVHAEEQSDHHDGRQNKEQLK